MKKKEHGGTRPGAGRPEKSDKKITYSAKLRPDHIAFLRSLDNAGAWLETLIDGGMSRDTQNAQADQIKSTAILAPPRAVRTMSWTCTCGVGNSAPAKGATVACSACRTRVPTGNTGLVMRGELKTRIESAGVNGVTYLQTGWSAGVWVSDLLATKDGETCPWAVDMPKDTALITPLESIY